MLKVKTAVKPSPVHGLGLFADEFIPAGTVMWEFTPGFDITYTDEQASVLPEHQRRYMKMYSWHSDGLNYMAVDDTRYTNHSPEPNVADNRAVRDIHCGEEILEDYREFDDQFNGY